MMLLQIDVEKSSHYQLSRNEIGGDNPCYQHLSWQVSGVTGIEGISRKSKKLETPQERRGPVDVITKLASQRLE
jgi:hypothetical protein